MINLHKAETYDEKVEEDEDCDVIPDDEDNCPTTSNTNPEDLDSNGLDITCVDDYDDDDVLDSDDNCLLISDSD
jgi:hypothetical protein